MKKFFSVMLVAVSLFFITNQAEAREVYVGRYSDGTAVYLLDDTVKERNYENSATFWCRVRAGRVYLDYDFWWVRGGSWQYRNSEGYSGYVYDGSSPVAAAIMDYIGR